MNKPNQFKYEFIQDGDVSFAPDLLAYKVRIGDKYYVIEPKDHVGVLPA